MGTGREIRRVRTESEMEMPPTTDKADSVRSLDTQDYHDMILNPFDTTITIIYYLTVLIYILILL